ncbi:hypothetical protein Ancab_039034 [Ancistrocladus abbreviatus]
MSRLASQFNQKDDLSLHPPPPSPYPSFHYPSSGIGSAQVSGSSKTSPAFLLAIVVLAVILFVSGLLHLLIRFLIKRPTFHSLSHSNRYPDSTRTDALQRQLQQLFRLHDSGLDQALIDALPLFYYKDIMGLKEPFDCAVCLCEFSDDDKLRLLPVCSHAFHINCIDTWLLSNSTCPLCRGAIVSSSFALESQVFGFDRLRELSNGSVDDTDQGHSCNTRPSVMEEAAGVRRVYSVRLGKFRSLNNGGDLDSRGTENGETSSSNVDARRCYSLASYQYVLGTSNLEVALADNNVCRGGVSSGKVRGQSGNALVNGDTDGKKISRRNRRDSFSVSKIWLWSKKGKFPGPDETDMGGPPIDVGLPLTNRDQAIKELK